MVIGSGGRRGRFLVRAAALRRRRAGEEQSGSRAAAGLPACASLPSVPFPSFPAPPAASGRRCRTRSVSPRRGGGGRMGGTGGPPAATSDRAFSLSPPPAFSLCLPSFFFIIFSSEKVFASLPQVERGVSKILGGDPKGNNFLYTNGKCVVIRNADVTYPDLFRSVP